MRFLALIGLSWNIEFAWNWPCFRPQTGNSKANLVIFCRSTFVYKYGRLRAEAKMEAGMIACKAMDIKMDVLLPLVEAFKVCLANLSLLVEERLQQIYDLTIFLKIN